MVGFWMSLKRPFEFGSGASFFLGGVGGGFIWGSWNGNLPNSLNWVQVVGLLAVIQFIGG